MAKRIKSQHDYKYQIRKDGEQSAFSYKCTYDEFFEGLRVLVWTAGDGRTSVHLMRTPANNIKTQIILKACTIEQWRELRAALKESADNRDSNNFLRLTVGEKARFKIDSVPNESGGFITTVSICRYSKDQFDDVTYFDTQQQAVSSSSGGGGGGGGKDKFWHHEQQSIVLSDSHIDKLLKDGTLNKI